MPGCAAEARTIVSNINRLAQATRTAGGTVIWIQTEALIADPLDWANRKEATSAARWTERQSLLARSDEGISDLSHLRGPARGQDGDQVPLLGIHSLSVGTG